MNVSSIPAFLSSDARTAFLFQNASLTFFNNARSASSTRPVFLIQNARPAFYLSQYAKIVFLIQNARLAF